MAHINIIKPPMEENITDEKMVLVHAILAGDVQLVQEQMEKGLHPSSFIRIDDNPKSIQLFKDNLGFSKTSYVKAMLVLGKASITQDKKIAIAECLRRHHARLTETTDDALSLMSIVVEKGEWDFASWIAKSASSYEKEAVFKDAFLGFLESLGKGGKLGSLGSMFSSDAKASQDMIAARYAWFTSHFDIDRHMTMPPESSFQSVFTGAFHLALINGAVPPELLHDWSRWQQKNPKLRLTALPVPETIGDYRPRHGTACSNSLAVIVKSDGLFSPQGYDWFLEHYGADLKAQHEIQINDARQESKEKNRAIVNIFEHPIRALCKFGFGLGIGPEENVTALEEERIRRFNRLVKVGYSVNDAWAGAATVDKGSLCHSIPLWQRAVESGRYAWADFLCPQIDWTSFGYEGDGRFLFFSEHFNVDSVNSKTMVAVLSAPEKHYDLLWETIKNQCGDMDCFLRGPNKKHSPQTQKKEPVRADIFMQEASKMGAFVFMLSMIKAGANANVVDAQKGYSIYQMLNSGLSEWENSKTSYPNAYRLNMGALSDIVKLLFKNNIIPNEAEENSMGINRELDELCTIEKALLIRKSTFPHETPSDASDEISADADQRQPAPSISSDGKITRPRHPKRLV